jgi:hypothetical protein
MQKLWRGFKRFADWCAIFSLFCWLLAWAIGSYQACRILVPDDVIPAADAWLASWAAKGRP